ncbi:MAG: hypothetical protein HYY32_03035 [Chloroflexi bacterium]|nr:hypothetical protein [Chloroflexota bacterium]
MVAEKAGVPTVTDVCSAFVEQARAIGGMSGVPGGRVAAYPGHIDMHSVEQRSTYFRETVLPQIIAALTGPVTEPAGESGAEPALRDIVFSGTFDEVNEFFHGRGWSDGLPVVPPTIQRVEQFLKYTDRPCDEVIGVLPPSNCAATVWSVAVNGVMAGCRPEYMPVLIALVEVMATPQFNLATAGATPGWEALIILNGPIIKHLGFNCGVGALRPGPLPNTSVGRFWRLYLRNVPVFIPGSTDKGTWGRNFDVVLAENHDALDEIGWAPLSVQQGFAAGDNVVTVQSARGRGYDTAVRGSTARENLDRVSYALLCFQQNRINQITSKQSMLLGLTPLNAGVIARDGFPRKEDVVQYLWERVRLPARVIEAIGDEGSPWEARPGFGKDLRDAARMGLLPELYCESNDPERMLPVWRSPDELRIVVSGDPGRNRALIIGSNIEHGLATSKKIGLPANWEKLPKR